MSVRFTGKAAIGGLVLAAGLARGDPTPTLAQRLLAGYDAVQSVRCEIRRDTVAANGPSVRMLSRVYFERPDRLHVENASPVRRRIVADGRYFYSYIEGDPKGFSRPIEKLDEEMLLQLRKVPGTPMDHLLKLKDTIETELPAEEGFPVRRGYDTGRLFVVLSLDSTGRLARIEFFDSPDMKNKTAQYDYSAFQEVAADVWIPCLHRGSVWFGGVETKETTRVDNLVVNQPVPPSLFIAAPFFQGVEFVDDFGDLYGKPAGGK